MLNLANRAGAGLDCTSADVACILMVPIWPQTYRSPPAVPNRNWGKGSAGFLKEGSYIISHVENQLLCWQNQLTAI